MNGAESTDPRRERRSGVVRNGTACSCWRCSGSAVGLGREYGVAVAPNPPLCRLDLDTLPNAPSSSMTPSHEGPGCPAVQMAVRGCKDLSAAGSSDRPALVSLTTAKHRSSHAILMAGCPPPTTISGNGGMGFPPRSRWGRGGAGHVLGEGGWRAFPPRLPGLTPMHHRVGTSCWHVSRPPSPHHAHIHIPLRRCAHIECDSMATVRTASRSLAAPSSGVAKSSSSGSRLSFGTLTTYTGVRRPNNIDQASQPWSKGPQTLKEAVNKATRRVGKGPRTEARQVTRMMFERFTEKAIKVVMLAQEEARRLGHNFVGTEQILLGLIGESTGGLVVAWGCRAGTPECGGVAGVAAGPRHCLRTEHRRDRVLHTSWDPLLAGMCHTRACWDGVHTWACHPLEPSAQRAVKLPFTTSGPCTGSRGPPCEPL